MYRNLNFYFKIVFPLTCPISKIGMGFALHGLTHMIYVSKQLGVWFTLPSVVHTYIHCLPSLAHIVLSCFVKCSCSFSEIKEKQVANHFAFCLTLVGNFLCILMLCLKHCVGFIYENSLMPSTLSFHYFLHIRQCITIFIPISFLHCFFIINFAKQSHNHQLFEVFVTCILYA